MPRFTPRWPGSIIVASVLLDEAKAIRWMLPSGYVQYDTDLSADAVRFAPRWIAWLYRLLPTSFGFMWPVTRDKLDAGYYLVWIHAPTWGFGLMARHKLVPALRFWIWRFDFSMILPWGERLYYWWCRQ